MTRPLVFGVACRLPTTFTGASSALVGVLPRSPVVPGGEGNQVSSFAFHRTYSITQERARVKDQNFILK